MKKQVFPDLWQVYSRLTGCDLTYYSLFPSVSKYLLSSSCVPGLGTGIQDKADEVSALMELIFLRFLILFSAYFFPISLQSFIHLLIHSMCISLPPLMCQTLFVHLFTKIYCMPNVCQVLCKCWGHRWESYSLCLRGIHGLVGEIDG